jgi:anti-sigma factor RsiW
VNCAEAARLLDPYVDGEAGSTESATLQSHCATCAACRQRLVDLESLGRLVRRAPYYQPPARLRARIIGAGPRSRFTPRLLAWAATMTLAASAGGVVVVRSVLSRPGIEATASMADQVVSGHVRAMMGAHLFDVRSTDQHTVKPWFLGKLDFAPPVEDLAAQGFPLTGGRLDYLAGRPVAALVYQRRQHTINLFVWPASEGTAPIDARSIRGFQIQHWTRSGMAFWAVSDLNGAELKEFAAALGL